MLVATENYEWKTDDPNRAWKFFKAITSNILNRHAPLITKRIKGRPCPWLTSNVRAELNDRNAALRRFRSTKDDGDWNIPPPQTIPGQGPSRSKRVLSQLRQNEKDGLERIAALAAWETATVPDLSCRDQKYANSLSAANKHLQMKEWAFEAYFAGAIIDEVKGQSMEYHDLIKDPTRKPLWQTSLANKLGCLAQGLWLIELDFSEWIPTRRPRISNWIDCHKVWIWREV